MVNCFHSLSSIDCNYLKCLLDFLIFKTIATRSFSLSSALSWWWFNSTLFILFRQFFIYFNETADEFCVWNEQKIWMKRVIAENFLFKKVNFFFTWCCCAWQIVNMKPTNEKKNAKPFHFEEDGNSWKLIAAILTGLQFVIHFSLFCQAIEREPLNNHF